MQHETSEEQQSPAGSGSKRQLPAVINETMLRNSTDTIGRRNAGITHRRVQSGAVLSSMFLDRPAALRHRVRSMSLNQQPPSLRKFYPGSHLLAGRGGGGEYLEQGSYLSLWLLPPPHLLPRLSREIAQLSLQFSNFGSSAPFVPHVTVVGSIQCESKRHERELAALLRDGLQGSGPVPCRFAKNAPCVAMYNDADGNDDSNNGKRLVWSQACIAIMERSDEYLALLAQARHLLGLPPGEWMFPAPACEPHFSKFYGHRDILSSRGGGGDSDNNGAGIVVPTPDDFVAQEAALYYTTPGTVEGVGQWREVTRINLLSS